MTGREKGDDDERRRKKLEKGNEDLVLETKLEDEEEEKGLCLFTACRSGMAEVVQQQLQSTMVDLTVCNQAQQTVLHVISTPDLQEKVVQWMSRDSRPHLAPQAQLLQAAWQGDLLSLQQLIACPDKPDVNAPNGDGTTPLMLAIRDVDLFHGMGARLPWQHRPVEVTKELLGHSADVQIRDVSGCSALHYAANISCSLRDEIITVLVEALNCSG
ncbi:uncharacterized protein LOC114455071 [Gouania willdenowi]|uniref:uncharacterized protein LOC114455071 n=1 Tax=Gouania willdenowi TaxID=441366 RepID=UPI001054C5D3|nr:uncharacterized protein LOC114455071 [Gouania willdenowi]